MKVIMLVMFVLVTVTNIAAAVWRTNTFGTYVDPTHGPSNMCLYLTEKCNFDVRFLSNSLDKWQGDGVLSNWCLNLTAKRLF